MAQDFISDEEMMGLEKTGKAKTPDFISDEEMTKKTVQPTEEKKGGFLSALKAYDKWAQGDNFLKSFATGIAKKEIKDVQGLEQTVLRGAEMVSGKERGALGSQQTFGIDTENKNMAESIGGLTTTIAEYAATGGPIKTAAAWINGVSNGIRAGKATNFLSSAFRAWGKAGVEGVRTYAQERILGGTEEGAKEQAVTAGVFAGLTSGLINTVGETFRAFSQPKKVVEKILRDTRQSLSRGEEGEAIRQIQKTNPTLFRQMVTEGLVKVDDAGNAIVDDTLATQALNRGIVSSPEAMRNTIFTNKASTELAKREILKTYTTPIDIAKNSKRYENALFKVIERADDLGITTDDVTKAEELINKISEGNGKIDPNTAYEMRTYIDRMIGNNGFTSEGKKITTTLSSKELLNLRTGLKTELDKNPAFKKVMEDYKFYIEAWNSLLRSRLTEQTSKISGVGDFLGQATTGARLKIAQSATGNKVPTTGGLTTRATAGNLIGNQLFGE